MGFTQLNSPKNLSCINIQKRLIHFGLSSTLRSQIKIYERYLLRLRASKQLLGNREGNFRKCDMSRMRKLITNALKNYNGNMLCLIFSLLLPRIYFKGLVFDCRRLHVVSCKVQEFPVYRSLVLPWTTLCPKRDLTVDNSN